MSFLFPSCKLSVRWKEWAESPCREGDSVLFDGAERNSALLLATWAGAVSLYPVMAVPQPDGYRIPRTERRFLGCSRKTHQSIVPRFHFYWFPARLGHRRATRNLRASSLLPA